jgi:tellurite resistance protein
MHSLALDEGEAKEVFEAARQRSGLLTLEEKTAKMRNLMPRFVDCMALMAAADGELHDEERYGIRAVLRNIPDMAVLTAEELDEAIDAALARVTGRDPADELAGIAKVIDGPADRYWTAVYMMIVALADGKSDWREVAFLESAKKSFALSEFQMDVAMDTARQFPAVAIGGEAPI